MSKKKEKTFTEELELAEEQVQAKALSVWQYLRDNCIGQGSLNAELHLNAAREIVKEGMQPVVNRVLVYKLEIFGLRGEIRKIKSERAKLKRTIKGLEKPKEELIATVEDKLETKGNITKKWLKELFVTMSGKEKDNE